MFYFRDLEDYKEKFKKSIEQFDTSTVGAKKGLWNDFKSMFKSKKTTNLDDSSNKSTSSSQS
jgi:predicted PolB exonuclease-like 3'-5' exonuclease